MKKHLKIISVVLLTLAPLKLFTMEKEKEHQNINLAINHLSRSLKSIGIENFLNTSSEELSQKLSIFDNEPEKIRDCLIGITAIIEQTPRSENTIDAVRNLKKVRENLYKQLIKLKKSKQEAKEFCFDILYGISDQETEPDNYSQRHYYEYRTIETILEKNELIRATFTDLNNIFAAEQKSKEKHIQNLCTQLEQEKIELANLKLLKEKNNSDQKILKIVNDILAVRAEQQKEKMREQAEALRKEIEEINNWITQLTQQKPDLTIGISLLDAKSKLTDATNALSQLEKLYAGIEKKTSFLGDLGWFFGLTSYKNSIPPITTPTINTNQEITNQNRDTIIQIEPDPNSQTKPDQVIEIEPQHNTQQKQPMNKEQLLL